MESIIEKNKLKIIDKIIYDSYKNLMDFNYIKQNISIDNTNMPLNLSEEEFRLRIVHRYLPSINIFLGELIEEQKYIDAEKYAHSNAIKINKYLLKSPLSLSSFNGLSNVGYSVLSISKNKNRYKNFMKYINNLIKYKINQIFPHLDKENINNIECINGFSGLLRYMIEFKDEYDMLLTIKKILDYIISFIIGERNTRNIFDQSTNAGLKEEFQLDKQFLKCKEIDFGLSHGLAGPLSILAIALINGIEVPGQKDAIKRILDILYRYKIDNDGVIYWPRKIKVKNDNEYSRLSWCYGVSGISRSIYIAGKALENNYYIKDSINIILSNCKLKMDKIGFISPTFCHGYSGLLHILNIFYNETGLTDFKKNINELVDIILSYYDKNSAFGFCNYEYSTNNYLKYNKKIIKYNDISFLQGSISTLLPLLNLIKGGGNKWEHILLLN